MAGPRLTTEYPASRRGRCYDQSMTAQLLPGADASDPTTPPPAGTLLVCGYVGLPGAGSPDTPHIWTADEWNAALTAAPGSRALPIATHSYDNGDPAISAANAVQACLNLGWAPNRPGGREKIIFIDGEVLVDADYFAAMQERIADEGFIPVLYGSSYFIRQNPSPYGYWDAAWTARPPSVLPPNSLGVQWSPGTAWDRSVFSPVVFNRAGIGPRKG